MCQFTQEQQIPYLRYTSTLNLYTLIGSCMNKNVQMHLQIPQGLFPICEVTRSQESGLEGNARIDAINPELGSDVAFQDRSKTGQDGPIDLGFLMVLNGNQKLVSRYRLKCKFFAPESADRFIVAILFVLLAVA